MLKEFTLWEAIKIGGPVMYFLMMCSVLSIAIILERIFYYYLRSRVSRANFMKLIREQLENGDLEGVFERCRKTRSPFAAVVAVGLNSSLHGEQEISDALEREITIETSYLERYTAIVGTIASTAVYIGLLGTVWGIIKTFRDIAQVGSNNINVVITGISEALVCTAAGLFVAIPAVMAYNYFQKRINTFVMDMELCASEIAGLIKWHKKIKAKHERKT